MLFSKIGRLNQVGIKVGLDMGVLLSLFVIAALVSLIQARIVGEKARAITAVEEPTSAAAIVAPAWGWTSAASSVR